MSPPAQALAFAIVAGLAALFTSEKWREYREVTIGAAEHGVELPTFSEYAAFQIGRYVRFAFFSALLIGGLIAVISADSWTLYTRPIGGLTVLDIECASTQGRRARLEESSR
jgi:hypothetical protein